MFSIHQTGWFIHFENGFYPFFANELFISARLISLSSNCVYWQVKLFMGSKSMPLTDTMRLCDSEDLRWQCVTQHMLGHNIDQPCTKHNNRVDVRCSCSSGPSGPGSLSSRNNSPRRRAVPNARPVNHIALLFRRHGRWTVLTEWLIAPFFPPRCRVTLSPSHLFLLPVLVSRLSPPLSVFPLTPNIPSDLTARFSRADRWKTRQHKALNIKMMNIFSSMGGGKWENVANNSTHCFPPSLIKHSDVSPNVFVVEMKRVMMHLDHMLLELSFESKNKWTSFGQRGSLPCCQYTTAE